MEKRTAGIILAVLAVALLLIAPWGKITGKIVGSDAKICRETDWGDMPYAKGTVTLTYVSKNTTKIYTDKCSLWETALVEYYCSDNAIKSKSYKCYRGCKHGACITNLTCADSDRGATYNVTGNTCLDSECKIDKCDGKKLIEYYCSENLRKSVNHTCGVNCSGGRCIK